MAKNSTEEKEPCVHCDGIGAIEVATIQVGRIMAVIPAPCRFCKGTGFVEKKEE